jgi:hypothetical protein
MKYIFCVMYKWFYREWQNPEMFYLRMKYVVVRQDLHVKQITAKNN